MRQAAVTLIGFLVLAGGAVAAQQHDAPAPAKAGAKAGGAAGVQAKIRDAMRAAPADISKNAAVMDFPDAPGGLMKSLRAGTNGWTCMPSTGVGGGIGADPMCLDKNFMAWADAWMSKKDPQVQTIGTAYMLQGDKGASNTDPFATGPTSSNQWVKSGPHVMVILPVLSQLDAYGTDPTAGQPWVMWKGTKYAHLMMPVAAMPKAAAKPAGAAAAK